MTDVTSLLADRLTSLKWMMSTAESCTGGLMAAHCTDLPGSSRWFERGFVTYSNAMALGAVYRTPARVSVAVTGIAGPDGGSPDKPVGTVWLAWCIDGQVHAERQNFAGDRQSVRQATVAWGLQGLLLRLPSRTA